MLFSRRELGRLLIKAGCVQYLFAQRGSAKAYSFETDRLLVENPCETVTDQHRAYRADAVVSILSVPIFSRAGVGSGFASFREARGTGFTIVTSRFGGGSFPGRAHNLNRLGFIEEVVLEKDSVPAEAAYFGFMTSSPEEGIGAARRSLEQTSTSVSYVATEGHLSSGECRSSKTRFLFPARLTWADRSSLLREVRAQFHQTSPDTRKIEVTSWPGSFLHLIATAIRRHPATFHGEYVYNAKTFNLTLEKTADGRAATSFAAKRLTSRPEAVVLFSGSIHDNRTGKNTKFRIWAEEDAGILPLRIELQARSFLSLAFEFDPALQAGKETEI